MRKFKELLLDLSEANDNFNPFAFAKKAIEALKLNEISNDEFVGLTIELDYVCKKLNIKTTM